MIPSVFLCYVLTMMNIPDDLNGDVLRGLVADGDKLILPRDIDFSLLFGDQASATAFAEIFSARGDRTEVKKFDGDSDVTITRFMIPDHSDITDLEAELAALAKPLGGRNDGWGCFTITD